SRRRRVSSAGGGGCAPLAPRVMLPFVPVKPPGGPTTAHPLRKAKEQVIARLNLASDPFRNRALPWTVSVLVSALSLAALVLILAQYREVSAEAAATERQVQAMRAQRGQLERGPAHREPEVRQGRGRVRVDAARLLRAARAASRRVGRRGRLTPAERAPRQDFRRGGARLDLRDDAAKGTTSVAGRSAL